MDRLLAPEPDRDRRLNDRPPSRGGAGAHLPNYWVNPKQLVGALQF